MKKIFLFLPLVILFAVVIFLVMQLQKPDAISPSEDWRDKPLPEFTLPSLLEPHLLITRQDLPKEPFILNVWASWCTWCIKEFPMLSQLEQQGVKIVGLTYTDKPDDARNALAKWGNPFVFVIDDSQQDFLVQTLKVSAAPTSYLVDKHGIIRFQQKGYHIDFIQEFLPRIEALRKEP